MTTETQTLVVRRDRDSRYVGQVLGVTPDGYRVQILEEHGFFTYEVRTPSDTFRIGTEFFTVVALP